MMNTQRNEDIHSLATQRIEQEFDNMEEILSLLRSTSPKTVFRGILKWSRQPSQWMTDPEFLTSFIAALKPFFLPQLLYCSDPTLQYVALKILACLLHAFDSQIPYKVQLCIPYVVHLIQHLPLNRHLIFSSSSRLPPEETKHSSFTTTTTPISASSSDNLIVPDANALLRFDASEGSGLPDTTTTSSLTPPFSSYMWNFPNTTAPTCKENVSFENITATSTAEDSVPLVSVDSSDTKTEIFNRDKAEEGRLSDDKNETETAKTTLFQASEDISSQVTPSSPPPALPTIFLTSNTVYQTALDCIFLILKSKDSILKTAVSTSLNVHVLSPFSRWAIRVDQGNVSEAFLKAVVASLLFCGEGNEDVVYLPRVMIERKTETGDRLNGNWPDEGFASSIIDDGEDDEDEEEFFTEFWEGFEDFKENGFELHEAWLKEETSGHASDAAPALESSPSLLSKTLKTEEETADFSSNAAVQNSAPGRILSSSCISLNMFAVILEKFAEDTARPFLDALKDDSLLVSTMDILAMLLSYGIKDANLWKLYSSFLTSIFIHPHLETAKLHCLSHLCQWIHRLKEEANEALSIFKHQHLLAVSKEVFLLLKNRLPTQYRESLFLLIGYLFHAYGFSWITKENEDILRLFPKLCSVEIQLLLHAFTTTHLNDAHTHPEKCLGFLGNTYYAMEIFIGALEENIYFLEKPAFPLRYTMDIFDSIHSCMDAIFAFIHASLEATATEMLSIARNKEISWLRAASGRLLGRWMRVEPTKHHQEFLEVLPLLIKSDIPQETFVFLFQSLENFLPSEWYHLEGMLSTLLTSFCDVSLNTWEEGNGNLSSCYAILLAAALMDPMCAIFEAIFPPPSKWKITKGEVEELPSLYNVHTFPSAFAIPLLELPSCILQPPLFSPQQHDGLTKFSTLCNLAHTVFLQLKFSMFLQEAQKKSPHSLSPLGGNAPSSKFLWAGGNIAAIAAMIGVRSTQTLVLQHLEETLLLAIWDTLVTFFIYLTPPHASTFLIDSNSPSVSLWFRLARVLALSFPLHPYLVSIFFLKWEEIQAKENWMFSVLSEIQNLPVGDKGDLPSEDELDDEDYAIMQYFSKLLTVKDI